MDRKTDKARGEELEREAGGWASEDRKWLETANPFSAVSCCCRFPGR